MPFENRFPTIFTGYSNIETVTSGDFSKQMQLRIRAGWHTDIWTYLAVTSDISGTLPSFIAGDQLVAGSWRNCSSFKPTVFGSLVFLGKSRTCRAPIIVPHIYTNCFTGPVRLTNEYPLKMGYKSEYRSRVTGELPYYSKLQSNVLCKLNTVIM
jgi:hypothetical protein